MHIMDDVISHSNEPYTKHFMFRHNSECIRAVLTNTQAGKMHNIGWLLEELHDVQMILIGELNLVTNDEYEQPVEWNEFVEQVMPFYRQLEFMLASLGTPVTYSIISVN